MMTPSAQEPPQLRQGPRPLALHMAMEGWIQQASFAGLMPSNGEWPLLNQTHVGWLRSSQTFLSPIQAVAALAAGKKPEDFAGAWTDYIEPVPFLDSVTREARSRLETFVAGVKAYQAHPYRRALQPPPPVWRRGSASLVAYGDHRGHPGQGPPVLFIPSLINRAYILDLAEDRSLLRAAAAAGLQSFLLDWGAPNEGEEAFAIEDYIDGIIIPALEEIKDRTGQAARLVGYCMGGTLAVAPAVLRPDLVSALGLLAAPWDFHVDSDASRFLITLARGPLEVMIEAEGSASVDLLQALFASLDPTLAGRKFRRFAALDPGSESARRFVELEDWLNDGVPLAAPVAREVIFGWYGTNDPALGAWRIGGTVIDPAQISCPAAAFIPSQDRIVPPESARRLARAIPGAEVHDVSLGHIGMIAGGAAQRRVYDPLIQWLNRV